MALARSESLPTARLEYHGATSAVKGKNLVEAVNLALSGGDFIALVGPNGAGKSTLLRLALGLMPATAGHVSLDGAPIGNLSPRERAGKLAWLPQHSTFREALPAEEVVATARYRFGEAHSRSLEAARQSLARVSASALAKRRVTELSGGERQRVALAALLAQQAPLLLVDEPANHLDPAQQIDAYELLGRLWREGYGVLCVTHDVNLLRHVGQTERLRVVGMAEGQIRFDLEYREAALAPALEELFQVQMHAIDAPVARVLVAERRARSEPDEGAGAP
jgi:iron complex transport system ATP-binding protein